MDALGAVSDPSVPVDRAVAERDLVTKLLARLSKEERSLIMLKEVEGHTVEELAAMTGLNKNTIKVRLFKIRQKLIEVVRRLHACPATTRHAYGCQSPLTLDSLRESTVTSLT